MSIRKVISSSFLLLVSIVILAHAVVPHHHNGISLITGAVPDEHDDIHENCLLSKVYLRLSSDKQTVRLLDFVFDFFSGCSLSLFSDNSTFQIKNDDVMPFEQKPYLQSNHTEFIARSTGLRAPPVFN